MTKCKTTDISKFQNCNIKITEDALIDSYIFKFIIHFLEIIKALKIFDSFSNYKIFIFQKVKLIFFKFSKLLSFENSLIFQIERFRIFDYSLN